MKDLFKNSAYAGLILLFVSSGAGCTSTRQTAKTETTVTYPDETSKSGDQGVVAKSETTTTTTKETKPENPGVLSSTFHAIGYVLELPFILVGGFFKMIFGG